MSTYQEAVQRRLDALQDGPPRLGIYLPGDGVERARGMRMLRQGEVAHPWVLVPALSGRHEVAHYTVALAHDLSYDALSAADEHARIVLASPAASLGLKRGA